MSTPSSPVSSERGGLPGPDTGAVLGRRYTLGARIGSGGFSHVYVAHDGVTGAEVAVKLLIAREAARPKVRQRFVQEAQIGASLNHPNLVRIFDLGSHGERPYLVMERLHGRTLYELIVDRIDPLPWRDVCGLMLQLLRGVGELHRTGTIHRDIKPGNCFLGRDAADERTLKLLDFGLAKHTHRFTIVSTPGTTLGTRAYTSPEAFRGEPVDSRADIYSVGCTFYQALTHKAPFHGNLEQVKRMHLEDTPCPPSRRNPAARIPDAVDRLVLRALAKRPDDRFPDVHAFLAAVADALVPAPLVTPDYPPTAVRGAALAGMWLCGAAVGFALGGTLLGDRPAPQPARSVSLADRVEPPAPTLAVIPFVTPTAAPVSPPPPALHDPAAPTEPRAAALGRRLRRIPGLPEDPHYLTLRILDGRATPVGWDARELPDDAPWVDELARRVARLRFPRTRAVRLLVVEIPG